MLNSLPIHRHPAFVTAFSCLVFSGSVLAQQIEIDVIDVDQGQSVLVTGPTGKHLLIDAGNLGVGNSVVKPYLQSRGITSLDWTVMTHWHTDHFGGMTDIHNSSYKPIVAAYDRGDLDRPSNSFVTSYLNAVAGKRAIATLNQVIDLGGGASATVIAVNGNYVGGYADPTGDENAYSIGIVVSYLDFDMYIAGDLTSGGLGAPNVEGPATTAVAQVEVAIASHHGSSSSSSSTAVSHLNPSFVAISAGHDNPYGHPTEVTINNWNTLAATRVVWCTSDGDTVLATGGDPGSFNAVNGHIAITSNGTTFHVASSSNPEALDFATFENPGTYPGAQQVVINELLVDPLASSDSFGEWFELLNNTGVTVDLGGMSFVSGAQSAKLASHVLLAAGQRFVVGVDGRRNRNGNVFPGVGLPWGQFALANGTSSLQLKSQANVVMETVAWGGAGIAITPGISAERIVAGGGTGPSNFAAALTAWSGGDKGTPWGMNGNSPPPCPTPVAYGTGKLTSNGTWPTVTWTGTPSATTNDFVVKLIDAMPLKSCIGFWSTQQGANPFYGGTLWTQTPVVRLGLTTTDATGSTSYAIPVDASMAGSYRYYQFWFRDPLVPDGTNVGLSAALSVRFCPLPPPAVAGDVVVTEIMKDPSFVADTAGEWIELLNTRATSIDIEGWTLHDNGTDAHVIVNGGNGVVIAPGARIVIGVNSSFATNGGINVVYQYAYSEFVLGNADDEVVLASDTGLEIDRVEYDNGLLWPDIAGNSLTLRAGSENAVSNDDGNYWCNSSVPIGGASTDTGTPDAANEVCP